MDQEKLTLAGDDTSSVSHLADEGQLAAIDAQIAALLAEPVDLLADSKKALDDFVDDMENPALQITSSGMPDTLEVNYRDIFLTPGDDVKTFAEILHEIDTAAAEQPLDEDKSFAGSALEGSFARGDALSTSDGLGSLTGGGLAAGAGVLVGAGAALAAKLGAKKTTEMAQTLWHYAAEDGAQLGPLPESDLLARLRSGQISPRAYVWREGLTDWISLSEAGLLQEPQQAVQQHSSPQPPVSMSNEEPLWLYLDANHQQVGPVSQSQLQALLAANHIGRDCLVWTEGMAEWKSAVAVGLAHGAVTQQDNPQCPGCGKTLAPGSKFCGGCGMKMGAAAPSSAAAPMQANCPRCQAALKPNARFCAKCGHQLSSTVR